MVHLVEDLVNSAVGFLGGIGAVTIFYKIRYNALQRRKHDAKH